MVLVSRINGPETLVSVAPMTVAVFQLRVCARHVILSISSSSAASFFIASPQPVQRPSAEPLHGTKYIAFRRLIWLAKNTIRIETVDMASAVREFRELAHSKSATEQPA